LQVQITNN